MWPEQNTAFLVIHGTGPHRPFATLDSFVRGFWNVLKDQNPDIKVQWKHKLQRHGDWIENLISLAPEGKPVIDFYEYYWDCYMIRDVTIGEVFEWIDTASAGAARFYAEMPDLVNRYKALGIDLFKDGEFNFRGYRVLLGSFSTIRRLILLCGIITQPFAGWASNYIDNMIGDIVIYTTADVRSKNYEIRQKMLSGAVEELRLLLNNDYYKQIIIAGHSLGSVIAYDALNRIALDMSIEGCLSPDLAQRIRGLVTFGSPLDKIAFFFHEHIADEDFVQQQILAHFHGFKSRSLPGDQNAISIDNPIRHDLDKAVWLNFYHRQDLISGSLDAYQVDQNILCEEKVKGLSEAHSSYWTCDQMYKDIAKEFF